MGWPQKLNTFSGRILWRTLVCEVILAHYSSPEAISTSQRKSNLPPSGCLSKIAHFGGQPVRSPNVPLSVVQDDIQQRTVNVQSAVILDEAQFAEPVHEEVDSGARRANDLGQHLLADLGDHRLRSAFLPEVRQQEKH